MGGGEEKKKKSVVFLWNRAVHQEVERTVKQVYLICYLLYDVTPCCKAKILSSLHPLLIKKRKTIYHSILPMLAALHLWEMRAFRRKRSIRKAAECL